MGRSSRINEPHTVEQILRVLSAGVSVETAAQCVGISRSTLFGWLQLGREARVLSEQGVEVSPVQQKYLDFLDSSEREIAISIANAVARIARASEKSDWRAAAWWLERQVPSEFGKTDRLKIGRNNGDPRRVQIEMGDLEKKIARVIVVENRSGGP
jgi:hypothetical protein